MTWALVRKLLRDVRVAWIVVAVLIFLFQILWARVTSRVTTQILTALQGAGLSLDFLQRVFMGPGEMIGQMIQAIIGGEKIELDKPDNFMSISYVHPLPLTMLGIWAIGRAANAIAGEIERGTMELLLAQPIRRTQLIVAHLLVDAIVFPSLCVVMWLGTYCGTWWMGLQTLPPPTQSVDPMRFLPALMCVCGLLFAHSGVTMAISSLGRQRARVWGWAITIFLCMFLINVLGQIWDDQIGWIRPYTVHYHYLPQGIILHADWYNSREAWLHLLVLSGVGAVGYAFAWVTFCRRDLPAPL